MHGHEARLRGAAALVGEHEQRDPDRVLRRREARERELHAAQVPVEEDSAEDTRLAHAQRKPGHGRRWSERTRVRDDAARLRPRPARSAAAFRRDNRPPQRLRARGTRREVSPRTCAAFDLSVCAIRCTCSASADAGSAQGRELTRQPVEEIADQLGHEFRVADRLLESRERSVERLRRRRIGIVSRRLQRVLRPSVARGHDSDTPHGRAQARRACGPAVPAGPHAVVNR